MQQVVTNQMEAVSVENFQGGETMSYSVVSKGNYSEGDKIDL